MGLIATYWTEHHVDGYQSPDVFVEGTSVVSFREGWYKDPSMTEGQLIRREIIGRNSFDTVMFQIFEEWEYKHPKGPPRFHKKEMWGKVYLPASNTGRQLTLLQEERTRFWTFCPWAKDTLAFRREVNAKVIYDLKPLPLLPAEAEARAQEKGYTTDGATEEDRRLVLDNARLWSEAVRDRTIVEKASVNQTTKWVEGVITEETDVKEEIDRFTIWVHRKFALRPDQNNVEGPQYVTKQDYQYDLGTPVQPPDVSATDSGSEGIKVEVLGGGADIEVQLATRAAIFRRGTEMYRVFRKRIEEDERPASGDPFRIWDGPPLPDPRREIIEHTFIGGYDGVVDPAENPGVGAETSYDEPHDPAPAVPDSWRHLTDAVNLANDIDRDEGHVTVFDKDVRDGGVYAYAAVAVIQDSESPLSNEARVTRSTEGGETMSISVRTNEDGSVDADVELPDDPNIIEMDDFGETVEFEVPAAVTPSDWPPMPADVATLTSGSVVSTEEVTFTHTPRLAPEEWPIGRRILISDATGPTKPGLGHVPTLWSVEGVIKTTDVATQTVVEALNADGHTYPAGSLIQPLLDGYDQRVDLEVGDHDTGRIEALILAIGRRQGLKNRTESFSIKVEVDQPLLGLMAGSTIRLADINWQTFGNLYWLQSRVEEAIWTLKGWETSVAMGSNGRLDEAKTTLFLEER